MRFKRWLRLAITSALISAPAVQAEPVAPADDYADIYRTLERTAILNDYSYDGDAVRAVIDRYIEDDIFNEGVILEYCFARFGSDPGRRGRWNVFFKQTVLSVMFYHWSAPQAGSDRMATEFVAWHRALAHDVVTAMITAGIYKTYAPIEMCRDLVNVSFKHEG